MEFYMDEFLVKLLSGKLTSMIADFNAIDRHQMYEFKWSNLLNALNVQVQIATQ